MAKIYHNAKCSNSRRALELLRSHNIEVEVVSYLDSGLSVFEVEEIVRVLGVGSVLDIVRVDEWEYRDCVNSLSSSCSSVNDDGTSSLTESELIDILVKYPKLLQRPIAIHNGKGVVGRPPERVLGLF